MDDWSLEKLSIKSAKLSPPFHKNTFEYTSTVSSSVDKIHVDCLTSDGGASYQIKGNKGSRDVQLIEGLITEVDVEVTSEDGTVGHYIIRIKRLSSKEAVLQSLTVDKGALVPEFDAQKDEYFVNVPVDVTDIVIKATAPDPKCSLTVDGKQITEKTTLNIGNTLVVISVGSIDGSVKKLYKVQVTRAPMVRFMKIKSNALQMKFEDRFSLSPLYQPVMVRGSSPPSVYSQAIVAELTRTNKTDPLTQVNLAPDWMIPAYDIDTELSSATALIPLTYGGFSEERPVMELPQALEKSCAIPKVAEPGAECVSVSIKHSYVLRSWEKNLHQIFDETNGSKLITMSQKLWEKYLKSLPDKPDVSQTWPENESPLDYITQSAYCLACAIKSKKNDAAAHLQLGLALEEKYLSEDMFGLKQDTNESMSELASLNLNVKAGSKEEEIQAICKLHGVDDKAPLSLVLKALDTEYQAMKNSGQTAKAEQVQTLFVWKNKQATQEGAAAQKAADDQNPLGQAYLKYLDALSLDESKSVYHFHVGRLQVIQGHYDDAVVRLQSALSWNKQHQMARFYLGLALTLREGGAKQRAVEAFTYIQEAVELLLTKLSHQALGKDNGERQMLVNDLLRMTNVHILRGIISLGKIVQENPDLSKSSMGAEDLYHTAVLLACLALPEVARGDLRKQLEWVILEGHSLLLDQMIAQRQHPVHMVRRCEGLIAMIRSSSIERSHQLAALHQKACEALVSIQPCSSQALYLLGESQLSLFDLDPSANNASSILNDCKNSLLASIEKEGQSTHSDLPKQLQDQKWWKEYQINTAKTQGNTAQGGALKSEEDKSTPVSRPTGKAAVSVKGGTTQGKAVGRGTTTKPQVAFLQTTAGKAASGSTPSTKKSTAAAPKSKGNAANKAIASPANTTSSNKNVSSTKDTASSQVNNNNKPTTEQAAGKDNSGFKHELPSMVNKKSHHARLCLARALSRIDQDSEESKKYYNEVITLSPEVHDAYIELADILRKTDPLAAVDVYSKFPVPENLGFDDAYIFGEIVLILFKFEKFDHPQLAANMIRLGQIMGIGYLEKYVKKLEEKFQNSLLKKVYAGIHNKSVDDPDMIQFFKMKYWV